MNGSIDITTQLDNDGPAAEVAETAILLPPALPWHPRWRDASPVRPARTA